jgi:uncharacterized protein with HEPN domain
MTRNSGSSDSSGSSSSDSDDSRHAETSSKASSQMDEDDNEDAGEDDLIEITAEIASGQDALPEMALSPMEKRIIKAFLKSSNSTSVVPSLEVIGEAQKYLFDTMQRKTKQSKNCATQSVRNLLPSSMTECQRKCTLLVCGNLIIELNKERNRITNRLRKSESSESASAVAISKSSGSGKGRIFLHYCYKRLRAAVVNSRSHLYIDI